MAMMVSPPAMITAPMICSRLGRSRKMSAPRMTPAQTLPACTALTLMARPPSTRARKKNTLPMT